MKQNSLCTGQSNKQQSLNIPMISLNHLLSLLRISHWTKAAFVLLGVFYSASLYFLPRALLAALAFCLISSAVYIYNDIHDRREDRLHPHKKRRPLASGEVSMPTAFAVLILLLVLGLSLAWLISSELLAILGFYLLINIGYNHLFKHIPVLDVLCIASGFMLRVLAGTIGIGLPISWWLTCSATLISLFIALCKRRLEKKLDLEVETRAVLQKYPLSLLDSLIHSTALMCLITYVLYIVFARDESFYLILTLPFAAIGLWRFSWLTRRSCDNDDPFHLLIHDPLSCINLFSFVLLTLGALFK